MNNLKTLMFLAALLMAGCTVLDNPYDEKNPNYTEYTLTVNNATDGGSVSIAPNNVTYKYGERVTATAKAGEGYEFAGWSGALTATNTTVIVRMTKNETLTANFRQKQGTAGFTITFNANGGTVSPTSGKTDTNWKLDSLPTPKKANYLFNGWYTAADATVGDSVKLGNVYNADDTIYAGWEAAFIDIRDSKKYKWVTIGSQTWMAENLNYRDSASSNDTVGVCYNNSVDSCAKYGRLYTWADAKTACPSGWHLPTDDEWTTLVTYAGGESTAGGKLKSTSDWNINRETDKGTDEFGFSALPGGDGYGGSFGSAGNRGNWWSATEDDAYSA